jgi:hypothetical protein
MKKIKRKLIKIQNNAAKSGGKIPSIAEALIMLRKAEGNDSK